MLFYLRRDGRGSRSGSSIRYVMSSFCTTVSMFLSFFKPRISVNLVTSLSGQSSNPMHSLCWKHQCAARFHKSLAKKSMGQWEENTDSSQKSLHCCSLSVLCKMSDGDKCAAAALRSQLLPGCLLRLLLWF